MRAAGATRGQTALAISLDGAVAVAGGTALAVAGAVAVSPLAPVGPVRAFDPARGLSADPLVLAAVFGASLNGLVTHPARYGWNWTLLMETEGGYGSWPPAQMEKLVSGQPGVTGWSTFAFTQVPIDNTEVPVLGLTRYQGSVEPPT